MELFSIRIQRTFQLVSTVSFASLLIESGLLDEPETQDEAE